MLVIMLNHVNDRVKVTVYNHVNNTICVTGEESLFNQVLYIFCAVSELKTNDSRCSANIRA